MLITMKWLIRVFLGLLDFCGRLLKPDFYFGHDNWQALLLVPGVEILCFWFCKSLLSENAWFAIKICFGMYVTVWTMRVMVKLNAVSLSKEERNISWIIPLQQSSMLKKKKKTKGSVLRVAVILATTRLSDRGKKN